MLSLKMILYTFPTLNYVKYQIACNNRTNTVNTYLINTSVIVEKGEWPARGTRAS